MKLALFTFFAALQIANAQSKVQPVELSAACKKQIEAFALKSELALVAQKGDKLASRFEAVSYVNHFPKEAVANVVVQLEDAADGRSVSYSAKVKKSDIAKCQINLARAKYGCRYSTSDGPDGLNSIKGLKYVSGDMVSSSEGLSALQKRQIVKFLNGVNKISESKEIDFLIQQTDDQELSTGELTLPDGRVMSYFGAYGGDNPYGIFFLKGTVAVAGDNGDGFVCISEKK